MKSKNFLRAVALSVVVFAACAASANDVIAEEAEEAEPKTSEHKWFSFHAFADIETAYICRGYIWDSRPYSAQYADTVIDFDKFGRAEAAVWTYSAMSSSGHSAEMSRYAYAEVDYILRYHYDIEIAEDWRLQNGVGHQWVTNPGFCGGHTSFDWQALQTLHNPWLTPYWRLRVFRRPAQELLWIVGVKRSFRILDDLSLTFDLSGDLGGNRHYVNLYGPKGGRPGARYTGGLHDLVFVTRLDSALFDHVSLFAFVGQFCLVSSDARDAVKAASGPEMRRDLTFGGTGIAVDF